MVATGVFALVVERLHPPTRARIFNSTFTSNLRFPVTQESRFFMYCNAVSHPVATTTSKCDRIATDELTNGDIIKHFTGDVWLVVSEPEYTNSGITFDVMWLDVDSSDNIQSVCFSPHWRFELATHQSLLDSSTIAA